MARAQEACFGWHYYGRPQTAENWCEDCYRLREGEVEHTVSGSIRDAYRQPLPERFPLPGGPFVQLKPGW